MFTLKPGRGPSIQRAIGGLVAGLFGVLWTVFAVAVTADAPFPVVGIVFPLFGVLITVSAWGSAAYHFINATSEQRYAESDFVMHADEPDPLNAKFSPQTKSNLAKPAQKFCTHCGGGLEGSFRYCPGCGTKV